MRPAYHFDTTKKKPHNTGWLGTVTHVFGRWDRLGVCMASNESIAPFLNDIELRPLNLDNDRGLEPVGLALGNGQGALEVAVEATQPRQIQEDGGFGPGVGLGERHVECAPEALVGCAEEAGRGVGAGERVLGHAYLAYAPLRLVDLEDPAVMRARLGGPALGG